LDLLGLLYLLYVFTIILFQIGWSGYLKEMGIGERGNILIKMGARLEGGGFEPGGAWRFGVFVKGVNVGLLISFLVLNPTVLNLIWVILMVGGISIMTFLLCRPRGYDRPKELKRMSLMEILSIYAPIPLIVGWVWAVPLMVIGVFYFIYVNKALWGVSYPKV